MPQNPTLPVVDITVRMFGRDYGVVPSFTDLLLGSNVLGDFSAGWYDAWCVDP